MKKKLLFLLSCLLGMGSASAYDIEDGGIYYNYDLESMKASVVAKGDGTKYTGDIVIPETFTKGNKTFMVVAIEKKAFYDCDGLTSISIPKTVILINDNAFYSCNSLQEIVLPEEMYAVGNSTFEYCTGVKKLVLPTKLDHLLTYAFANMTGLEELVIPDGWTEIGTENCDEFFANCTSLKKLTIGTGVTVIREEAFAGCSQLSEVVFKSNENLTTLEESVFYNTAISDTRFLPASLETLPRGTFSDCEQMTEIYIPAGIKTVKSGAFGQPGSRVKSVYVEDSETPLEIDGWHIECMPEKVYIGRPLSGNLPFYPRKQMSKLSSPYLKQLTLGANYTQTEKRKGFLDVGNALQWLCCMSTHPENIYAEFTNNVYANALLYVPKGAIEAYRSTAPWSNFFDVRDMATLDREAEPQTPGRPASSDYDFEDGGIYYKYDLENQAAYVVPKGDDTKYTGDVVIPETITKGNKTFMVISIEKKAFYDCDGLTSISIPKTVILINDNAFYSCNSLQEIVLPEEMYAVGNSTFEYCTGVKKLVLPTKLDHLLTYAFANMTGLEELVIPDEWTEIGTENCDEFFANCTSLKKLTIGAGVTVIREEAFAGCSQLSEVVFKSNENLTTLEESVFYNTAISDTRFLPASLETLPRGTFSDCEQMTEICIPAGIKTVECGAFGTPRYNRIKSVYVEDSETPLNMDCYIDCMPEKVYIGRPLSGRVPYCPNSNASYYNKNYMKQLTLGVNYTLTENKKNQIDAGESLEWVCCLSTHPENIFAEFTNKVYANAPLYVPKEAIEAYKSTAPWSNFFDVRDMATLEEEPEPEPEPQWAVGDTFTATNTQNVAVRYKVVSIDPKKVELAYDKNNETQRAAVPMDTEGAITIPEEVNGFTVVGVGDYAFSLCHNVTKIGVPATVTYVGDGAFSSCDNLERVGGLVYIQRIGRNGFAYCGKLAELTLPETLTFIGAQAFHNCSSLTSLNIPKSVIEIEANFVTAGCIGLQTITVDKDNPKYDSRDNCNAIVETATNKLIAGCVKTVIPESIVEITAGAFSELTNLTEITIPASVADIAFQTFQGCTGLQSVTMLREEPFAIDESTFTNYSGDRDLIYANATLFVPKGSADKYRVTEGWSKFQKIEEIGGSQELAVGDTFSTSTAEGIDVRYKVVSLEPKQVELAYDNDNETQRAAIPMDSEGTVTIPEEVNGYIVVGVGDYAFSMCRNITKIALPATVTYVGDGAFSSCDNLEKIGGLVSIERIGRNGFAYCGKLEKLTLPETLTFIGAQAFRNCSSLTSLNIPKSVTEIEANFVTAGCTGLQSITVDPENPKYDSRNDCNAIIDKKAYTLIAGCVNTVFPTDIYEIGDGAFCELTNLETVVLPPNIGDFGYMAFGGCTGLKSFTIQSQMPPVIESSVFANADIENNATLYVPKGCVDDYASAEGWSNFSTITEFRTPDLSDGLVAYYPLDVSASDMSGNPNHGTVSENVSETAGVKIDYGYAGAYQFGGYDNPGQIQVADDESLHFTDEASFSLFVKPTSWVGMDDWGRKIEENGTQAFLAKSHDTTGAGFVLRGNDESMSVFIASHSSAIVQPSITLEGCYRNKWTHIAFVFEKNRACLYVDGKLVDTKEGASDLSLFNGQDLYIGKFSDRWYPFNGAIDEVMIHNRALTAEEVNMIAKYADELSSIPILLGDANGDGIVDANDIVEVVNYIAGNPSDNFILASADANSDGIVNAADIVVIANIIMDN